MISMAVLEDLKKGLDAMPEYVEDVQVWVTGHRINFRWVDDQWQLLDQVTGEHGGNS